MSSKTYNPYNSPAMERFSVGTRKPVVRTRQVPKSKQKPTVQAKSDLLVEDRVENPTTQKTDPQSRDTTPSFAAEETKVDSPREENNGGKQEIPSPVLEDKSEDDILLSRSPHTAKTEGRNTKLTRRQFQRPGRKDIPVSIENEHRYINSTVNSTLVEVRTFRRSYKADGCDFEKCIETANDILAKLSLVEEDIEDPDQFRRILATRKLGKEIRDRLEVGHLEILCDKARKFEEMMTDVQSKLTNCVHKHLAKYCLSFAEECKHVYIACVEEYKQNIQTYKNSLEGKLQAINKALEEYGSLKSPFVQGYLKNGQHIIEVMDGCVGQVFEVCNTMRRWTIADKAYPGKLWDEIKRDNKDRTKTIDDLKKVRQTREEHLQMVQKKELIRDKAAVKFTEAKMERRKLKTHKENLADRYSQSEAELEEKKESLKDATHAYNNRKSNSPKVMEILWDKKTLYEQEIAKIEERLGMLRRQRERYEKEDAELEEKVTEYEYDLMGKQGDVDSVRSKIKTCEGKINGFLRDLRIRDSKIVAAKTLRDMKLSPATLRKIYFQKMDTGSEDILMEVCKVVATNIGRHWEGLYLDLQFTPPRSKEKRLKDLDNVKLHSVHREITGRKLAWQGLQKWRIFNKRSSVEQILKSLRRLEKFALAHKVEHMHKKSTTAIES